MDKLIWHTEQKKINELIPFEGNPRQMTDKQNEDLKKSLEKFNLVEIPAVDTDNIIVAGHQRLRILQLLGRGDEVIDIRVPNRKLTTDEFQEYNIRSNKNLGEWDYDLLANFEDNLLVNAGFEEQELEKQFLDDFDDEQVNAEYKFGTINSWVRVGDFTAEISDKKYQAIKGIIGDNKGLVNLIDKIIAENKNV